MNWLSGEIAFHFCIFPCFFSLYTISNSSLCRGNDEFSILSNGFPDFTSRAWSTLHYSINASSICQYSPQIRIPFLGSGWFIPVQIGFMDVDKRVICYKWQFPTLPHCMKSTCWNIHLLCFPARDFISGFKRFCQSWNCFYNVTLCIHEFSHIIQQRKASHSLSIFEDQFIVDLILSSSVSIDSSIIQSWVHLLSGPVFSLISCFSEIRKCSFLNSELLMFSDHAISVCKLKKNLTFPSMLWNNMDLLLNLENIQGSKSS